MSQEEIRRRDNPGEPAEAAGPAHDLEGEGGRDHAAELIKQTGYTVVLTPENNARVLRKIDWHILPIILGIYFLQSLDKATLAYASVFGLIDSTHLVGLQYSWLGSVVYLAQLVVQPLTAYLLVKVPLGKFLAVSILCWGIVLSFMTVAKSFPGLLVCRMFLGAFEAGVGRAWFETVVEEWKR
jgi:Major Facilitator Superfamily